jgi:hypothetical protein
MCLLVLLSNYRHLFGPSSRCGIPSDGIKIWLLDASRTSFFICYYWRFLPQGLHARSQPVGLWSPLRYQLKAKDVTTCCSEIRKQEHSCLSVIKFTTWTTWWDTLLPWLFFYARISQHFIQDPRESILSVLVHHLERAAPDILCAQAATVRLI